MGEIKWNGLPRMVLITKLEKADAIWMEGSGGGGDILEMK